MIVTILIRGPERYIVICDKQHGSEALRTLGRWACNPDLAFDWRDAAEMAKRLGEELCSGK